MPQTIDFYKNVSQCKICRSGFREQVDIRLASGIPYAAIIKWAIKQGLQLSKKNVSTHNRRHRTPSLSEIVPRKEPGSEIPLTPANAKLPRDKTMSVVTPLTNSEFCDLIINRVHEGILNNIMKPTVTEGLKAVELKMRINEGNPFESVLMDFLMTISENHGIRTPNANPGSKKKKPIEDAIIIEEEPIKTNA